MTTVPASSAPGPTRPRRPKWPLVAAAAVGLVLLAGAGLYRLIPSDEELALRASTELQAVLGVPVRVGALHWKLRPAVVVELEEVVVQQNPPILVSHLSARLNGAALWQRRIKVDRLEIDGATLPQLALRGLKVRPASLGPTAEVTGPAVADTDTARNSAGATGSADLTASAGSAAFAVPAGLFAVQFQADPVPLEQLVFRQVTWVSRYGSRVVYDGSVLFDPGWRPRQAELLRPGFEPATRLTLTRQARDDHWEVRSTVGGGSANGEMHLQSRANGQLQLGGKLQLRNVDAVSALAAFHRRSLIAGKVTGETTLSAQGASMAELARTLHTSTPFVMGPSTLLRFDLSRAIHTLGKEHAGKTPLDSVKGRVDTQNTADGMVIHFTQVKATSGALTASGEGRIAHRKIEAELAVDLVEGLVGVPLKLSGPLAHVKVSVPASAVAGAVVGTAVLPVVGTAIGARIGAAVEKIFQGKAARP